MVEQVPGEITRLNFLDRDFKTVVEGKLSSFEKNEIVHAVFVGTKPDIIKQYPIIKQLKTRNLQVLLVHTAQHSGWRNSGGMLKEFGLDVDLMFAHRPTDEGLRPTLDSTVSSVVATASRLMAVMANSGYTVIPYVHGDTATAMSVSVASYMSGLACVHVEAGIRTLSPRRQFWEETFRRVELGRFKWEDFKRHHSLRDSFERGGHEPYPEQFNTRVAAGAAGLHAAPVELNRDFLLAEGFPDSHIIVAGNSVVDALVPPTETDEERVMKEFPRLGSGEFIRFCIHRRENTGSRTRFVTYFDAIEALLNRGHSILWILLSGTEKALRVWDLEERLESLRERFPSTFIVSGVWAEYGMVKAAYRAIALLATDSGSMQEEANALGVPCVTLRYGSDRGESLLAGGNVLAPPLSVKFVTEVVDQAFRNRAELIGSRIYLPGASQAIVSAVCERAVVGPGLFFSDGSYYWNEKL